MNKSEKKMKKTMTQMDFIRGIRKPMPPPSRAHKSKDTYNRKDKSWKDEG